ncbi:FAD-binding oxidoreductase [Steroidobacter sp.]|uniref:FAD-binding oxidoreductase n=1 Tax=Steroidobacter sp. TaxID=1978227 RepID=UPI001A490495|nr:FAD-binding oxidoreductase [Steroidobacter sp.]MBL8265121.1 FAD-binding oxidoreductase [Steroidobacter sp.]
MKRRDFVNSSLWAAAAAMPGFHVLSARANSVADVSALTGDGNEITLRSAAIKDLAARMRGELLLAGDEGYDQARMILNPSFDKHPALIARPASAADVQAAVGFAREHNLLVAVKCGGHSHSGQSTCERGMLIDLFNLRNVRVDPATRRTWVAGGSLLGQVDQASMPHGLVTPLGTVSHTGVGGLTLGGGFGRLARRYGMAIDNLTSIEIVTADGQLRRASATDHPDLFWGARGGSGNFGVVTQFEFALHPMQREVVAGTVAFPLAKARDVLSMYADYAPAAPDDLYIDPVIAAPPGGAPGMVTLEVCYSGPQNNAERALAPIRKLGTPDRDSIKAMDYVLAQRVNDVTDSRSVGSYLKGGFITKIPGDLISALVEGFEPDPGRMTLLFFQHCGGAVSRIADDATAFAHRHSLANMMTVAGWRHGVDDPSAHIAAIRRYWSKLEPFTRGFYVNDMAREVTASDINANYGGNYQRLVALKRKYDPTNLFRLNANVHP